MIYLYEILDTARTSSTAAWGVFVFTLLCAYFLGVITPKIFKPRSSHGRPQS